MPYVEGNNMVWKTRKPGAEHRPVLEILEARTLLSTCHVTRLTDQGIGQGLRGDLRYCITSANNNPGPDAIDFAVAGTVHLGSPLPGLSTDMDLQGPGAGLLTVRRSVLSYFRLLNVTGGATVGVSGLTLANGGVVANSFQESADGGGIYNAGTLAVSHCVL